LDIQIKEENSWLFVKQCQESQLKNILLRNKLISYQQSCDNVHLCCCLFNPQVPPDFIIRCAQVLYSQGQHGNLPIKNVSVNISPLRKEK